MVLPVDNSNVVASALSDPLLRRTDDAAARRLEEEEAARRQARFSGPNELARVSTAPTGSSTEPQANTRAGLVDRPDGVQEQISNRSASLRDLAPIRELVALSPEAQIQVFNAGNENDRVASGIDRPEATDTATRTTEFEPTARDGVDVAASDSRPREVEQTQEVADREFDRVSSRDALETITQAIPAKAGTILDLSV